MPDNATSTKLNVAVGTFPDGSAPLSLSPDIQIHKPALLFGDHVTFYSPHIQMMKHIASLEELSVEELVERLTSYVEHNNPSPLEKSLKILLQEIDTLKAKPSPTPEEIHQIRILEKYKHDIIETYRQTVSPRNNKLLKEIGYNQIRKVQKAGILTIADVSDDSRLILPTRLVDLTQDYVSHLESILESPSTYPLLDTNSSAMVEQLVAAGVLPNSVKRHQHSKQLELANHLVNTVPTFPNADLYEILDIRTELRKPLIGFRSGVMKLGSTIEAPLYGEEFEAAINAIVIQKIEPAVREINDLVELTRPLKKLARSARSSPTFIGGSVSLAMSAHDFLPILSTVSAMALPSDILTAGGVTAVLAALGSILNEIQDGNREIRNRDMYMLVALDRALQK
jgi:hypothetical protein